MTSGGTVFFDTCEAFGHLDAIIQVELAAHVLTAEGTKGVSIDRETTARLRCSREAALSLIAALEQAISMMDKQSTNASADVVKN